MDGYMCEKETKANVLTTCQPVRWDRMKNLVYWLSYLQVSKLCIMIYLDVWRLLHGFYFGQSPRCRDRMSGKDERFFGGEGESFEKGKRCGRSSRQIR